MKKFDFKRLLLPIVALAMMIPALTSCDPHDDPGNQTFPTSLRLVTFKHYIPGGGMEFTYRTGAVTPLINLTSSVSLKDSVVAPGERIIIGFNTPDGRSDTISGPIDLKVYRTVFNDTIIKATPEVLQSWASAMVSNTQVWRTGNFLNVGSYVPIANPIVPMAVYADEEKINAGVCHLYVTLKSMSVGPSQLAEVYSSINVCNFLRKYPSVHTFIVHAAGSSTPVTISDVSILPGE